MARPRLARFVPTWRRAGPFATGFLKSPPPDVPPPPARAANGLGRGGNVNFWRRRMKWATRGGGRRRRRRGEDRADKEKKKKESILDLSKYIDKTIRVKFQGGREASGVLKGFDPLLNLVLDGTIEYMRDPDDQFKLTEDTRQLGLVVCRGTSVVLICPQDGMEAIPNPFIQQQDG
ncbi:U6 snRNA-associated Sm-like protein LSm7 [Manacus vitellinus]|uniref:U6 snRNA-associated Sm-like protein LSm7 n=1 Tax=Manacus vitellinus TaxID=328815 RepID=UPI0008477BF0|nr:U6 snRNA-associated Sm-like protein LSm7 [Manacus vitellinus]